MGKVDNLTGSAFYLQLRRPFTCTSSISVTEGHLNLVCLDMIAATPAALLLRCVLPLHQPQKEPRTKFIYNHTRMLIR